MGKGRPGGNPDIKKAGKSTQFKPGKPGPAEGVTWKLRRNLARVLAEDIDADKIDEELARLVKRGSRMRGKKKTIKIGTLAAVRLVERLIKRAEPQMLEKIADATEGKQVQQTQELPPPNPYNTQFTSDEEADAAYREACKT